MPLIEPAPIVMTTSPSRTTIIRVAGMSAIAIARELGIEDEATQQGLAEFRGVGRRFTRYGEVAIPG
ncbi:MAG: hypothetical protein ACXWU7_07915, partial [Telluria sp.]